MKKKVEEQKVSTAVVVQAIEKEAGKTLKKLETMPTITTKDEYERAGLLLKELKSYVKTGKDKEASIVAPLKQALTATTQLFKPFYARVAALEESTKREMLAFLEHREIALKKLESKFESREIKKVDTFMRKSEELKVESSGTVQQRSVKQLVITNRNKIPAKYLVIDEAAVKKDLMAGIEIPGARLEIVKQLAI